MNAMLKLSNSLNLLVISPHYFIFFRKPLKRSSVPRFLHSAILLGNAMLVFGGNSHNGTAQLQSLLPCFSMDFLAYDIGELNQVSLVHINIKGLCHGLHILKSLALIFKVCCLYMYKSSPSRLTILVTVRFIIISFVFFFLSYYYNFQFSF